MDRVKLNELKSDVVRAVIDYTNEDDVRDM